MATPDKGWACGASAAYEAQKGCLHKRGEKGCSYCAYRRYDPSGAKQREYDELARGERRPGTTVIPSWLAKPEDYNNPHVTII